MRIAVALAFLVAAVFILPLSQPVDACEVDTGTATSAATTTDAACPRLVDRLNAFPNACWSIHPNNQTRRFKLSSLPAAEGGKALSVKLKKRDRANSTGIHKHEVRIDDTLRCGFDGVVWYAFSFAVEGDFSSMDTRWVIGQWKDDTDDSPFLAQRFNRGVFFITVEERRPGWVAGSDDPQRTVRRVIAFGPGYTSTSSPLLRNQFLSDHKIRNPITSFEPVFRPNAEPGIEDYDVEALQKALNNPASDTFLFLDDPEKYGDEGQITVTASPKPLLPDPTKGLVRMKYRVEMLRSGNSRIDVWANDRFIVSVTGPLGGPDAAGDTRYFKFGHYRDIRDDGFSWSKIYLDDFRRGATEADVE